MLNITIPDSVTTIGDSAFCHCDSLTSVVIGDSVTTIGDSAFYNFDSLTSIEVSEENEAYRSIDGNLYSKDGKTLIQYAIGKTDKEFVIPDSVTTIGDDAFFRCSSLTSVVIGDSVTSIGEVAFDSCSSLTSVVIGDSVTSIGNYAFSDCSSLTSVYITDLKAWCEIEFGNSYANPLIYGAKLYLNGELLTELVIPDSVTTIGDYAFYNCYSLTSVVIGDSVTSIGNWAFNNCSKLEKVYYKGTAEDWANITIGYNNSSLTSSTKRYYYSENEPTVAGNYWRYDEDGNVVEW